MNIKNKQALEEALRVVLWALWQLFGLMEVLTASVPVERAADWQGWVRDSGGSWGQISYIPVFENSYSLATNQSLWLSILHTHHSSRVILLKIFKNSFEREREREQEHEQGEVRGRGRSKLPTEQGTQCWGSIPGPWDRDLSQKQTLHWLSHPGALVAGSF